MESLNDFGWNQLIKFNGCDNRVQATTVSLEALTIAVMNMPEVMHDVWNMVTIMYAPIFLSVPWAGSLPQERQSACRAAYSFAHPSKHLEKQQIFSPDTG